MGMTVLPSERTGMDVLGKYIGEGMNNAMPQMYENQKTQRGLSAVDELQSALQGANGDMGKILPAIAKAYSLNPNLQRSGIAEHYIKQAQIKGEQDLPPPGGQPRDRSETFEAPQRGPEVNFLNQPTQQSKTFPNNFGPQGTTGNASQEATQGVKVPERTPDQMRKAAIERSKASKNTAFPLSPSEAYQEELLENEQAKKYNETIDLEKNKRVADQKNYGGFSSKALSDVYPAASSKMLKIAKKWGEDVSTKGKSEAEIEEHLVEKANNFANQIDNVKKSLSRPNLINNIERAIEGNYKTFDQGVQDVRNHLKPLLENGLYDEARGLLQDLDYGPEEREMIINPLSESDQTILNSLPKISGTNHFRKIAKLAPPNISDVKETLVELKKNNPNFSPLLARKYAEDRGYDWRIFKDAFNELIQEDDQKQPEEKSFVLSEDQKKMSGFLDTPPLSYLGKILHAVEGQGR